MKLAPETRFVMRHVGLGGPAGGAPATGGVLHAVGSRSEAVRLASVVTALRAEGVPQAVARLTTPATIAGEVFDPAGRPRTEFLVEHAPETDVQKAAQALPAAEQALLEQRPALVVVAGDSEVSLAVALAASKIGIPIARLGAGLRCGDFSLSEEINRTLIDRLGDVLFTDSDELADALECEGIDSSRVHHTGNTAIDLLHNSVAEGLRTAAWRRFGVEPGGYVLATLHRPENTHDEHRVLAIAQALCQLARRVPVVLPLHPATRARLEVVDGVQRLQDSGVHVSEPLGYLDFLSLEQSAGAILTDAGGVQDEASALGVRCYTLRRATERLVTLTHGTNVLLGEDPREIPEIRLEERPVAPASIPLWDGKAATRIAAELTRRVTLQLAG
jgi:UDP-N-acetylglucosamine 2-epimerase (non-hydrolysing)